MSRPNKAGRNDLCPCGSGKKLKRCCQDAARNKGSRTMLFVVFALIAGGIIAGIASFRNSATSPDAAGKVWSAEHGHYH